MPVKSVARAAQLVKPLVELLRLQHEVQGGGKPKSGERLSEADLIEQARQEIGKRGYDIVPKSKA